MTREKLIEFLLQQQGEEAILNMNGIIVTTIHIDNLRIEQKENYLYLNNVGLNLNQLMKISEVNKNEILLEFDQLQTVTIKITKAKSSLL